MFATNDATADGSLEPTVVVIQQQCMVMCQR